MPRRDTSFAVLPMLRQCSRRSSSGGQAPPPPSPDPQVVQLKETPEDSTMHGVGAQPYRTLLADISGKTSQMRSSDTFASPPLTAAGIARVEERPALELPRVTASSGKDAPEPGELDNSEHVSGRESAWGARRIRQPGCHSHEILVRVFLTVECLLFVFTGKPSRSCLRGGISALLGGLTTSARAAHACCASSRRRRLARAEGRRAEREVVGIRPAHGGVPRHPLPDLFASVDGGESGPGRALYA